MKKTAITLAVISLIVFVGAAGVLLYREGQSSRDDATLASLRQQIASAGEAFAEAPATDDVVQPFGTPRPLAQTDDPVLLAYRQTAQQNPDFAGWLKIDGTVIDYPVMRTPQDAEKYLHLSFDGQSSRAGTLFMLPISDPSVPNNNIIIYGHHMKDGSMFGALPAYEHKEAYDAQPYIQFDTLYERGLYRIVAIFRTSIGAENEFPYYRYEWLDDEETFDRYMRGVMANRLYDTDETATFGDQLLTLSTCDYHEPNGRLVLVAKKVPETEDTTNE